MRNSESNAAPAALDIIKDYTEKIYRKICSVNVRFFMVISSLYVLAGVWRGYVYLNSDIKKRTEGYWAQQTFTIGVASIFTFVVLYYISKHKAYRFLDYVVVTIHISVYVFTFAPIDVWKILPPEERLLQEPNRSK